MNRKLNLEKEIERSNRKCTDIMINIALVGMLWMGCGIVNISFRKPLPSAINYFVENYQYNCGENYKKEEPCPTNRFSPLSLLYK